MRQQQEFGLADVCSSAIVKQLYVGDFGIDPHDQFRIHELQQFAA